MDIILYGSPSTAATIAHWLLIELELEHRLELLDLRRREHKSPEYLRLNPQGRVPTLVIDGQAMTEAAAIVLHLADLCPQAGLTPPPGTAERAQYYRWAFFCSNTLQPAYRDWFYPHEPAGPGHEEAAMAQAREEIEGAWQIVADHLERQGPYLLGGRRCAVDFLLTILMRWSRNMPRPSDSWPVLREYVRRMKALPSFAELYRREGITDWL